MSIFWFACVEQLLACGLDKARENGLFIYDTNSSVRVLPCSSGLIIADLLLVCVCVCVQRTTSL